MVIILSHFYQYDYFLPDFYFIDILALDEGGLRALVLEKYYEMRELVNNVQEVTFDRFDRAFCRRLNDSFS